MPTWTPIMIPRSAFRTQRAAVQTHRCSRGLRRNVRYQSQSSSATPDSAAGSGALTGGLAGGGAALLVTYAWYQLSGTKSAVQSAKQTKAYVDSTIDSLKVKFEENTPDTDQALKTLRDAATKYAAFVPGAKQYVDSAFNDLESIRKKHGSEVDNVVSEAYGELRDASKKGMNMQAAGKVYNILTKHIERLLSLGKDATEDVLNNHPQLKEKLGGSAEQLQQLGERIGPQAKQEVDKAWKQVNQLVEQGMQVDTIPKAYSILQQASQKIQEMGEKAFNQGWEQLKPMLEKADPKVKEAVESNMDALKQGNVSETINKVKDAVQSGNMQDLQQYIDQIKNKASTAAAGASGYASSQISDWLETIPNGSQILSQLQSLKTVAEKRGEDAQGLLKETIEEIKQTLDRRAAEAEKLAEGAKQEVKNQ